MKYRAFISYRHGGIDEAVAATLHREIEKYTIPGRLRKKLNRKKIGRAFRDNEELRASSDLSAIIREALLESEWLIVICTKRLPESKWCLEEVENFIKIRGRERILLVLAEGEPDESFPKQLTEIETDEGTVHVEPLAVDVRGDSQREVIRKLKSEKLRLFAPIIDVEYDDLRQRQRERRTRRLAAIALTIMLILGGVIGVVTYKNIQLNAAYEALDESNRETLRGESNYLCEYSDDSFKMGDRDKAVEQALQALPEKIDDPEDRPYVPGVMKYLSQAMGVYDYTVGYKPGAFYTWEDGTVDSKSQASADGKRFMTEICFDAAANTLTREVRVYDRESRKLLYSAPMSQVSRNYYTQGATGAYISHDGKTLIYLAEDGLTAVEIDTGKTVYKKAKASELRVDEAEKTIVSVDYDGGKLYSYGFDGSEVIDCNMGSDINYALWSISPDSETVALSANTEEMSGILIISLKDGSNNMIPMNGLCSDVRFMDKNKLCFILTDNMDGLKHIVKYDMSIGDEGYLCNADWDVSEMTLAPGGACYYFHENKVFEVDGNSKKGDKVWDQVLSSTVLTVCYGDGLLAISCSDGTVTVYDEKTKDKLFTITGSGEPLYPGCVRDDFIILRDYWGATLRLYEKNDNSSKTGSELDISDITGKSMRSWYTSPTDCGVFAMGFHGEGYDRVGTFDGNALSSLAHKDLSEMDMTSFENKELDVKNDDYITIRDFETLSLAHYGAGDLAELLTLDEDDYFYYSEDGKTVYKADDKSVYELEATTGTEKDRWELPQGYDRGMRIGDAKVYGNDHSILIKKGSSEKTIDDAVITTFNDKRGLIFYRDKSEMNWSVYDIDADKVVCEGKSGVYSSMSFFCNNRYFFCDYSEVYDMDSWEPVLKINEGDSQVYGIQTTDKLPYFIVWCRKSEDSSEGANFARIHLKGGEHEVVAEIPNFVTMTTDGQIVAFDGVDKLYRFSLYGEQELINMARQLNYGLSE